MYPAAAFAFSLLALLFYTLHKVRAIHRLLYGLRDQTRHESTELFRQIEALLGLHVELGLSRSLPGTRGWAASPDFLLELARHARATRPATVVECGSGTSTLVLARCMQANGAGKVYTLEHDADYASRTRRQLELHGLSDWAEVLVAPLHAQQLAGENWPWYAADVLPAGLQIDLLAIDGPPLATGPLARYPAGPKLFPLLAPDAAVFLDDAARPDEQAVLARWWREFPQLKQSSRPCEKGCAVLVAARPAAIAG